MSRSKAFKTWNRRSPQTAPAPSSRWRPGSGKTFTAVNTSYRLIKFGEAKRILFLVDRNNLGKQALNEFQQYVSPYNNYKFTEEYTVQHLRRNTIDPAAKVCITTIQRLYSMLKGEEEFEEENEEGSLFEAAPRWSRSRCRSSTTRRFPSRRSTSSSSMSATARSTTSGGRCWNTSTPSSSA